jgi:two-component system, chemotaxis family, chemotaxis protein CheY
MKTALVVDDSKIVRKVTRGMLEPLGFTIAEAEDGVVARDYCKNTMPDLIMLDHNMPNMNGMECLKEVRSLPDGTKPKIIFCTTENEFTFIQNAIMGGADEFVMKPFDAEILKGKLQQVGLI